MKFFYSPATFNRRQKKIKSLQHIDGFVSEILFIQKLLKNMSQNKNLLDKLHKAQITPNAWKRETELHKIGNIVTGRAILPCNEIYKKIKQ